MSNPKHEPIKDQPGVPGKQPPVEDPQPSDPPERRPPADPPSPEPPISDPTTPPPIKASPCCAVLENLGMSAP